jgi:hypothetical protein
VRRPPSTKPCLPGVSLPHRQPSPSCWPSPPAGRAHGGQDPLDRDLLHTCRPSSSFLSCRLSSYRRGGPQWFLVAELVATSGETGGELLAAELQQRVIFSPFFLGRNTARYTPRCKWAFTIFMATPDPNGPNRTQKLIDPVGDALARQMQVAWINSPRVCCHHFA